MQWFTLSPQLGIWGNTLDIDTVVADEFINNAVKFQKPEASRFANEK